MAGGSIIMTNYYPNLSSLSNSTGIGGLLSLPNSSFPWYWTLMLVAVGIILTMTMYYRDKSLQGRGNILSSLAVASLACIVLGVLGSLLGLFTVVTLVPIIVFCVLIVAVWVISGK